MNDDEIEEMMRGMSAPTLPESWRESILAAARREAAPRERAHEAWPAMLVYWRHLFARNPLTVSALAAIWLAIFLFKVATPSDPAAERFMAQVDPHRPILVMPLAEQIRLAEAWQNEPERPLIP